MRSWIPALRTPDDPPPGSVIATPSLNPAQPVVEEEIGAVSTPWAFQVGRRLTRNRAAMVGLGLLLFVVLLSILAPIIGRYDPNKIPPITSTAQLNQTP